MFYQQNKSMSINNSVTSEEVKRRAETLLRRCEEVMYRDASDFNAILEISADALSPFVKYCIPKS